MGKIKVFLLSQLAAAVVSMSGAGLFMTAFAQERDVITVNPGSAPLTREQTKAMVEDAAEAFYRDDGLKAELEAEIERRYEVIPSDDNGNEEWEFYTLTHGGKTMRFFMEIIGEPDGNGRYPLYIALHGGGGTAAEANNGQWLDMFAYYQGAIERGIYLACRGITDTWDLHFQEDSYPLYDRLIEAMTVNDGADPDRVYLLGFSAGGDGVYQIAPRLADRFAAANMSSGHPNGVSLLNLANCPICLQVGIRDYYNEDVLRCVRAAEFEKTLSGYREEYGFGYDHRILLHVPEGHNFRDYEDGACLVLKDPSRFADPEVYEDLLNAFLDVLRNCGLGGSVEELSYFLAGADWDFDDGISEAVAQKPGLETTRVNASAAGYVSQYTRSPAPEKIIWDLSTRAQNREKDSFYWLEADPSVNRGTITAVCDASSNTITVEPDAEVNGDFAILFHPSVVDVSRPVILRTGSVTRTVQVYPSEEFLEDSMRENGDPYLGCVGKILYSEILSGDNTE